MFGSVGVRSRWVASGAVVAVAAGGGGESGYVCAGTFLTGDGSPAVCTP